MIRLEPVILGNKSRLKPSSLDSGLGICNLGSLCLVAWCRSAIQISAVDYVGGHSSIEKGCKTGEVKSSPLFVTWDGVMT